jgi:hypothetical protein
MPRLRKIYDETTLIDLMHKPEKKVILLMAKWSPLAVTIQKLLDFHTKKFLNCKFYYVDIEEFPEPKRYFDYTVIPIIKCIDNDGDLVSQKATTSNKKILKLISELNDTGFDNAKAKIDFRRFSKDPKQLEEFIKNRELKEIEIIEEDYYEDTEEEEEEEEKEIMMSGYDTEKRKKRRRERELMSEFIDIKEASEDEDVKRSIRKQLRESNVNKIVPPILKSKKSIDMDMIRKSREKRKKRLERDRQKEKKFERQIKLEESAKNSMKKQKRYEDEDEEDIIMDSDTESENETQRERSTKKQKRNGYKSEKEDVSIDEESVENNFSPGRNKRRKRKNRKREFTKKKSDSDDDGMNFFDAGFAHLDRVNKLRNEESELRKKKRDSDSDAKLFVRRSKSRSMSGRKRKFDDDKPKSTIRHRRQKRYSSQRKRNDSPWEKERKRERFEISKEDMIRNDYEDPYTSSKKRRRRHNNY